jgi:hypothetical protein
MFELLRAYFQDLFSKPAHYRPVFRAVRKTRINSIVQIGIGSGTVAGRLIALARRADPNAQIKFTGIDLFESRPANQEKCSLIDAHRKFNETGAKIKLMPGDALTALSRIANSIRSADLLIVAADQDPECIARAWFYVPRMLADNAIVLIEEKVAADKFKFKWLKKADVELLAKQRSKPLQRHVA